MHASTNKSLVVVVVDVIFLLFVLLCLHFESLCILMLVRTSIRIATLTRAYFLFLLTLSSSAFSRCLKITWELAQSIFVCRNHSIVFIILMLICVRLKLKAKSFYHHLMQSLIYSVFLS
jgi:hypothetical protein